MADSNANIRSENQAVIDFAKETLEVEVLAVPDPNSETGDGLVAVVPVGRQLKSLRPFLDEFRTAPERRAGTAKLTTERSFVDHVNRFKSDETVIFAKRDAAPSLAALYNYHPAGADHRDAGYGDFRALYEFPLSDEWKAWRASDGALKAMGMADFAAFLEDRLPDIIPIDTNEESEFLKFAAAVGGTFASPSRLLELSRSLEINAGVAVRQAVRLESGEITVSFVEQHSGADGKPIKVPSLFVIEIPIFVDGVRYRMVCRLRYRLQGTSVIWWYQMVRPQQYLEDAVKDSVLTVEEMTSRPVLYGESNH